MAYLDDTEDSEAETPDTETPEAEARDDRYSDDYQDVPHPNRWTGYHDGPVAVMSNQRSHGAFHGEIGEDEDVGDCSYY